jgi:lysophospholipase L1-like esterase
MKRLLPKLWIPFLAGLVVCFVSLIGIELAMRAAGYFLQRPTNQLNLPSPEDEKKLRILAIGESTTADYFAGGKTVAWPRQLEELLKKHGVSARVYNEGLGGTQSAFILSHLPDYLQIYRPHIVISMMGINDAFGLTYGDSFLQRLNEEFHQLRLFKLFQWSAAAASGLSSTCEISHLHFGLFQHEVEEGYRLSSRLSLKEIEEKLRNTLHTDAEVAVVLTGISVRMRGDFSSPSAIDRAMPYAERAFHLDPRNHWTIFWNVVGHPTPNQCAEVVRALAPCRDGLSDDLISGIAVCFVAFPELTNERMLWDHGLEVRKDLFLPTGAHYRRLHQMLQENGIVHIAMQYPTRPLSILQGYFSTESGVKSPGPVFVSNEFNFLQALSHRPYKDLFTDRFAKTWGHTTALGHRLIAENLVPVVMRIIAEKNPNFASTASR